MIKKINNFEEIANQRNFENMTLLLIPVHLKKFQLACWRINTDKAQKWVVEQLLSTINRMTDVINILFLNIITVVAEKEVCHGFNVFIDDMLT